MLFLLPTWVWRGLEERGVGLVLAMRGPVPWNDDVRLVSIDEETFLRYGRPFPRALVGRLVEAMSAAEAGAIAFDLVFDTPALAGPEDDAKLADALKAHGRSVMPVDCIERRLSDALESKARSQLEGKTLPRGPSLATPCRFVIMPTGPLPSATTSAHFLIAQSPSAYVRSVFPFADFGALRLPALSVATFLAARKLPASSLEQRVGGFRIGDLDVPMGPRGELIASYRGLPPGSVLSFVGLSEDLGTTDPPRFSPEVAAFIKGKHFVFGLTAMSAGDKGYFSGGSLLPQVALHLAVLSDLLEGQPVRELRGVPYALTVLLAAALLTAAALYLSYGRSLLSLVTFGLGVFALAYWLAGRGVLLQPMAPLLAATLSWSVTTVLRLGSRERERRVLGDAFGAYVDPRVLEHVLEDPARYLALAGARRTLTLLFSDISGFTALSNEMPPDVVISLLREYFEAMVSLITAERGRVDKIMGDGILAVFGDPIPVEDHAVRAVRVALQMQTTMIDLQQRWISRGAPRVGLRVGIATGEVYVGNIGARGKKVEYTVLGRPVNLAARLEHQAPTMGVLVAEQTREACGEAFRFIRFTGLRMKGFDGDQVAYLAVASSEAGNERRRQPRVCVEAQVRLRAAGQEGQGRVENVSFGGLYVTAALAVGVEDAVEVEVTSSVATARFRGVVTHVERDGSGSAGFGIRVSSEVGREGEHLLAILYGGALKAVAAEGSSPQV